MNTKTLNTHEKLWLANRASHSMALAGPTAFWLASGHREARPLVVPVNIFSWGDIFSGGVEIFSGGGGEGWLRYFQGGGGG